MSLFVDGELVGTPKDIGPNNPVSGMEDIVIGHFDGSSGFANSHFEGEIADVRVWNKALNATEIAQNLNQGVRFAEHLINPGQ